MAGFKEIKDKEVIFGLSLGAIAITMYLVYKAIGDYQTSKRIENMDNSLAKLAGTKPYGSRIIDKLTLKKYTDRFGNKIEELV